MRIRSGDGTIYMAARCTELSASPGIMGICQKGIKSKRSIVVIWVNDFQTELMAKIYFKSPVRAIGKVSLMKFS